jgi:serine/threonine-protein kinase
VFASDVYSVGVTMYQMLTGALPYGTPAPADLEKLMRGELVRAPRLMNSKIPRAINDIIMRALAADLTVRYARASDLLNDVLASSTLSVRKSVGPKSSATGPPTTPTRERVADIQSRLRARATPPPRFCWHCRKPLHARTMRCPFCNEVQ